MAALEESSKGRRWQGKLPAKMRIKKVKINILMPGWWLNLFLFCWWLAIFFWEIYSFYIHAK